MSEEKLTTLNRFAVTVHKGEISFIGAGLLRVRLSRDDALNLAAWLYIAANDMFDPNALYQEAFLDLVNRIRNT